MLSHWNKDDIANQKNLDDLLSKKVTWTISTAEVIQVYRALVWMVGLKEKIEQSQVEDVKITKLEEAPAEIVKEKKPRAKKSQGNRE